MYLRGSLLKNDSNFYFAEYDRKKAGEDGEEGAVPDDKNTSIHANPIAEEEQPLSPRPSKGTAGEDSSPPPSPKKPQETVKLEPGSASDILEQNKGLLTLREETTLTRDQELQLNQGRIKDTLIKAQHFMDSISILGATMERSTMTATKLLHCMPQANRDITEHSASIMEKLLRLEDTGLLEPVVLKGFKKARFESGSPKGGSVRDRSKMSNSSRNGSKMSRKKNGRGGPMASPTQGFHNPLFNNTDPTSDYGSTRPMLHWVWSVDGSQPVAH